MNMENEKEGLKVVILLNSGKQISFTSRKKYYNDYYKDVLKSIGKDRLLGLRTEEGSEFKRLSFINTKNIDNLNVTECDLEEDNIIFEFGIVDLEN